MQQTRTMERWGLLAVVLAAFALAFSLFALATPAYADDLQAGEADLSAQSSPTYWPLKIYVQDGEEAPVVVKGYTKDQLEKLNTDSSKFVSGLSTDGTEWYLTTAVVYVTLEDLLYDAEVYWGEGATITYSNTVTGQSQTFTYDTVQNAKYYPSMPNTTYDDGVLTSLVFATNYAEPMHIGTGMTAADIQEYARVTWTNNGALTAVMGSLEKDCKTLSGSTVSNNRFVEGVNKIVISYDNDPQLMYRLYNKYSGEHFYTASTEERDSLVAAGWTLEGEAWTSPQASNVPVYRLYNSYANYGDHHYTTNRDEYESLITAGWTGEGVGWCSDPAEGTPVYRLYNPNAYSTGKSGAHHYTTSADEKDSLVKAGWTAEGVGWYGIAIES